MEGPKLRTARSLRAGCENFKESATEGFIQMDYYYD